MSPANRKMHGISSILFKDVKNKSKYIGECMSDVASISCLLMDLRTAIYHHLSDCPSAFIGPYILFLRKF
ncbi:MAG: hypothetical protein ACP5I6_00920 [Caldisphaera sp.]|jgi:hypothetical protein|nr:hypothetical protein [Caldisphaera sp.]